MAIRNELRNESCQCRIAHGTVGEGRVGTYYGKIFIGQWWGIVVWDGEEDPDFFKAGSLEVASNLWKPA